MTFNLLIAYIKKLIESKWTGQLRVNLHKGDLSKKIEVKTIIMEKNGTWSDGSPIMRTKDILTTSHRLKGVTHCLNDVGNEE